MTDPVSLSELPGPLVEIGSNGELTIHVREPAVDGKAKTRSPGYWQPTFNCPEAESNWCPERRRAKSVSGSAAGPTGNPTAAIARVVVDALPKNVGRGTITKHITGSSSRPIGGVGSLAGGTPRRQDKVDLSGENGDFLS